ncbi:CerR family C-terminal domain-containing protein [Rhodobium gokarnense]|uniref:AcrR family transcriptional regulator n=1 Tax=Rhodobium gokarnense TaxID=364296 RepID=A0ABT3H8U0_9HYPH|nr:CerR family C-terminal domain-containing protein [Rhodobium gokarnense]MCW2306804.1 AcrR family transcriptional regulator [Rhodobium gokarnense]
MDAETKATPTAKTAPASPGRQKLLDAAIVLFGRKGFDATTTREIAEAAGVNIANIAYHFGGKEGLYRACAEELGRAIKARLTVVLDRAPPQGPLEARDAMTAVLSRMTRLIAADPAMAAPARFILREYFDPTPALRLLYRGLIEPISGRLIALWAAATGADPDSEETRLIVLGLVGQILVFRAARDAVCLRMEWETIGPREAEAIETMVIATLDARIAAEKEKRP